MPDSFEEQIADEIPEIDDENVDSSGKCPECGKFAQAASTHVRSRGTVTVYTCGHRG